MATSSVAAPGTLLAQIPRARAASMSIRSTLTDCVDVRGAGDQPRGSSRRRTGDPLRFAGPEHPDSETTSSSSRTPGAASASAISV